MQFVKTDDLKPGMRLAKPIYNKNGVLLYERDTKITVPGINSIRNFGLIGIFVLDPAEPAPPLTQEDIEFEQNQTIYMFKIKDTYTQIDKKEKKLEDFHLFLQNLVNTYGTLNHKVNFAQNLRSSDDFMYKHAISMGILTALMTRTLKISYREQLSIVAASLLYGYGYSTVPKAILDKGNNLEQSDKDTILIHLERGLESLSFYKDTYPYMANAYRYIQYMIDCKRSEPTIKNPDPFILVGSDILKVAEAYDSRTAMSLEHEPDSEIMAMKYLNAHPDDYNIGIVAALANSIHIIPFGANVDLSTGDKGIILQENPKDFMHPLVLRISDNKMYDLSDPEVAKEIQIVDIMKTMDNRVKIDADAIKEFQENHQKA